MKVSVLDLRRRMKDILRAVDRGESVTILRRGRAWAVSVPEGRSSAARDDVRTQAAFGMWKNREDLRDVAGFVRRIRQGRSRFFSP
jgi:prevent-host-death family protein